uniref:Glutaredoxin domain-containing protein n=1 Tax=Arundo donax TaxID=35708 RepID=A0A0A9DJ67_ARUDO
MIIKTLKARILRALKSVPAASAGADSPPPSPTKPGVRSGGGVASVHADDFSDDASFFDAHEAELPTKIHRPAGEAEPLDAWELVDQDGRAAPAPADPDLGQDPLLDFPARCPPGGEGAVVLYTTTLRGVRRTFEDCNGVRALLECLPVVFQERDVSMDRGLRDELWAVTGEKAVPPRLFVRGRDVGGAAQVLALHEEGRLVSLLSSAPDAGGGDDGKKKCEACGGLRFVVCGECDGSRKVFDGGRGAARCRGCNENGLVICPLCL